MLGSMLTHKIDLDRQETALDRIDHNSAHSHSAQITRQAMYD